MSVNGDGTLWHSARMAGSALQALWIVLPLLLGGLTHVIVLKMDGLAAWALPLDGGLTFRGRPLFGANKTVRGAVVMILATGTWAVALELGRRALGGPAHLLSLSPERVPAVVWGGLLGAGYVLGELPNSFIKRQLGIAPGAAAPGPARVVFWVADQTDSLLGVLLLVRFVTRPALAVGAWLFAFALIVHPAVAWLMVALGLKARVG